MKKKYYITPFVEFSIEEQDFICGVSNTSTETETVPDSKTDPDNPGGSSSTDPVPGTAKEGYFEDFEFNLEQ